MRTKYAMRPPAKLGLGAILGMVVAAASLGVSISGRPFWGLALAMLSLLLGMVGLVRSISPEIRGGLLSVAAVAMGAVGFVVALVMIVVRLAAG
jgi:hypothetical protein